MIKKKSSKRVLVKYIKEFLNKHEDEELPMIVEVLENSVFLTVVYSDQELFSFSLGELKDDN